MNLTSTFTDTPNQAYSHGLERIYKIENIDLRTVRRLNEESPPLSNAPKEVRLSSFNPPKKQQPSQLELDFGPSFRQWTHPLILLEPIQVLSLSSQTEKILEGYNKRSLKDLLDLNLNDLVFFKGIGQGHVDEIRQKLEHYIEGKSLEKSTTIDFISLIRILTAQLDRRKVFIYLDSFGLGDTLSLSPSDSVEVRRLSSEEKNNACQEIKEHLQDPIYFNLMQKIFKEIFQVFVQPWMQQRDGLATAEEVIERLQRQSLEPAQTSLIIEWLNGLFFEGTLFSCFLQEIEPSLYAVDSSIVANYKSISEKAFSYFYKLETGYLVSEFIELLAKEFSRQWVSYQDRLVNKILMYNPAFYSLKKRSSGIWIYLA